MRGNSIGIRQCVQTPNNEAAQTQTPRGWINETEVWLKRLKKNTRGGKRKKNNNQLFCTQETYVGGDDSRYVPVASLTLLRMCVSQGENLRSEENISFKGLPGEKPHNWGCYCCSSLLVCAEKNCTFLFLEDDKLNLILFSFFKKKFFNTLESPVMSEARSAWASIWKGDLRGIPGSW